jgi:hypothetical protein
MHQNTPAQVISLVSASETDWSPNGPVLGITNAHRAIEALEAAGYRIEKVKEAENSKP